MKGHLAINWYFAKTAFKQTVMNLNNIALHWTALQCSVLQCTTVHCTALQCTTLTRETLPQPLATSGWSKKISLRTSVWISTSFLEHTLSQFYTLTHLVSATSEFLLHIFCRIYFIHPATYDECFVTKAASSHLCPPFAGSEGGS